jgi:hypothetical protein
VTAESLAQEGEGEGGSTLFNTKHMLNQAMIEDSIDPPSIELQSASVVYVNPYTGSAAPWTLYYYCPMDYFIEPVCPPGFEGDEGTCPIKAQSTGWKLDSMQAKYIPGPNIFGKSEVETFSAPLLATVCEMSESDANYYIRDIGQVQYMRVFRALLPADKVDWPSGVEVYDFIGQFSNTGHPYAFAQQAWDLSDPVTANCPTLRNRAMTRAQECTSLAQEAISDGGLANLDQAWSRCLWRRNNIRGFMDRSTRDECSGQQVEDIGSAYEITANVLQGLIDAERAVADAREGMLDDLEVGLRATQRCLLKTFTTVASVGIQSHPLGVAGWKIADGATIAISSIAADEAMDIQGAVGALAKMGGYGSGGTCAEVIADQVCSLSQGIVTAGAKSMVGKMRGSKMAGQVLDARDPGWSGRYSDVFSHTDFLSHLDKAAAFCQEVGTHLGELNDLIEFGGKCSDVSVDPQLEEFFKDLESWATLCGHLAAD